MKTPNAFDQPPEIRALFHEVAEMADKYNQSADLALRIIKCESGYQPDAHNTNYKKDGTIASKDWGYWQINSSHWKEMEKMGLDVYNPEDNLRFGFYLLQKDGTVHWKASQDCWDTPPSTLLSTVEYRHMSLTGRQLV